MDGLVSSAASSKKILLVEDDTVLGEIYLRRFQSEGFNVKLVANGEDAPGAAKEFKPDIILLDLMIPGMNGLNVLDAIRKEPITSKTTVFVFSALGQPSDKDRAMELGADEYLVKSQDLLNDVIDKIKAKLNAPA
jgi:DNA-binding response OmpR family regulator